jgi:hypothetical protein
MRPLTVLVANLRRAVTGAARGGWRLSRAGFWPAVELAGAVLVCVCVGLYEPRLAVGLAGLILLLAANFRPRRTP